MNLLEKVTLVPLMERLIEETRGNRIANERIAACLESLTAAPEAPEYPDKPIGPEAIGTYGQQVETEETAEDMREKLREAGLNDREIEDALVAHMFSEDTE